jgi:signal transduction histidine kinase
MKGQPFEVVGSWTDITASRRMEAQLAQSQKMEAVGQLTGGVAHDFNNRLTVRQLLTFSRQQVLEPAVININELITGMQSLLQRTLSETVKVVVSPEPNLWPVKTDRSLLENVILNLAVNARDAMPRGGDLTIETSNQVLDDTWSGSHGREIQGDFVMLAVSDTGQGMSEETKRRAFEPFFTTKEAGKGTGLGLAMVYGFVKQSGGHIEIYSEPGHGTSFQIYLHGGSALPLTRYCR